MARTLPIGVALLFVLMVAVAMGGELGFSQATGGPSTQVRRPALKKKLSDGAISTFNALVP